MSTEKLAKVKINAPFLDGISSALKTVAGQEVLSQNMLQAMGCAAIVSALNPDLEINPDSPSLGLQVLTHLDLEQDGWNPNSESDYVRVELPERHAVAERALATAFTIAVVSALTVTGCAIREQLRKDK